MKLKNKINNKFIKDESGFGIEDAPFQILAAVLILVVTAGIGIHLWSNFNCGNQCQTAAEAALDIHRYSKLVSAGSEGSQKIIYCRLPEGFTITFSGGDIILSETPTNNCDCNIETKTLSVEGVDIEGPSLDSGYHKLKLEFKIVGGNSIVEVSEVP